MKQLLFFLFGALLFITACDKDDDPSVKDQLVGKWTLQSIVADGEEVIGTFIDTDSQGNVTEETNTGTMEFFSSDLVVFEFAYIYKENGQVIDNETYTATGTYTVDDDKNLSFTISLDGDDSSVDARIDQLDGNNLVFSGTGYDSFDPTDTYPMLFRATR